jgi:hypothetical protein
MKAMRVGRGTGNGESGTGSGEWGIERTQVRTAKNTSFRNLFLELELRMYVARSAAELEIRLCFHMS